MWWLQNKLDSSQRPVCLHVGERSKWSPIRPARHKWADMFPASTPLTAPTQTYFSILSFATLLFAWVTVENSDTHVLVFLFFTRYAQQEVKIMKASFPPMMAFLAGTLKKQSNCQLLVAWWLLSVFILPEAHDTFETFPWHDRHDKVVPFFIWNQYFKTFHMLHHWGSHLCSVAQRRCCCHSNSVCVKHIGQTKTDKNCKSKHDKQVWIHLFLKKKKKSQHLGDGK